MAKANMKGRNAPRVQDAKERIRNFDEVSHGFDDATMVEEANRCLNCKNAPCMGGCPVGIHIPEFISCLKEGDKEGASEVIARSTKLPAICGRVCPQERQCEKYCVRNRAGGAVAIGQLERCVGDYNLTKENVKSAPDPSAPAVAIVGSGPAGLTCAADCLSAGLRVTIFEAFHKAGGVLTYGIPEFRLPKAIVDKEISKLLDMGCEIKLNSVVGRSETIDELKRDYDAIFISSGAGLPQFLHIEGENLNGVMSANEFLTRVNLMKAYKKDSATPIYCGQNVVVVGAGNVAMDAARTAKRLGGDVTIVYRRSRDEIPARAEEVEHAEEEGVKFMLLTNPVSIGGDETGMVNRMTCIKMELGEPDASGRRRPIPVEGSEFDIATDHVIVALGTSPNPLIKKAFPMLSFNPRGAIVADENMFTGVEGIWAGGDVVTGSATVISAMGAGRKAAAQIIKYIGEKKK